jgi:hypothetical protein
MLSRAKYYWYGQIRADLFSAVSEHQLTHTIPLGVWATDVDYYRELTIGAPNWGPCPGLEGATGGGRGAGTTGCIVGVGSPEHCLRQHTRWIP